MEEQEIEKIIFLSWLAGLIDGDGCLTVSLSIRNYVGKDNDIRKYLSCIGQIRIGLKKNDSRILYKIRDKLNIGKIYYSNKDTEDGICYWQTTNWKDSKYIAELLIPYFDLKKEKAVKFLEICNICINSFGGSGKHNKLNGRARNKEDLLKVAKISTTLNYDRQTKRFREYKNYEYWEKVINELYN